jgi:predicted ferric reductase
MTVATSTLSSAPLWYVTRSTGVIAFVLMTVTFALGLAATQRALASPSWPRFATQQLHRNISLLRVVFLLAHIITTRADTVVHVGWWAWIVPFASGYRTAWVGLGTMAFDLLLVVLVTSLLRDRMPLRLWRAVHWTSYLVWPLAFLHFLKTGTDAAHGRWGLYLAVVSLIAVGVAATARWLTPNEPRGPVRSVRGVR